jgi:hypothetical protein
MTAKGHGTNPLARERSKRRGSRHQLNGRG